MGLDEAETLSGIETYTVQALYSLDQDRLDEAETLSGIETNRGDA